MPRMGEHCLLELVAEAAENLVDQLLDDEVQMPSIDSRAAMLELQDLLRQLQEYRERDS